MVVRRAAFRHGDVELRGALVGARIERRLRGDEVLVVEEGTAERTHEEVVAKRELLGKAPYPQVNRRLRVMAHRQGATVAPGDEAVVPAAVDLQLVVVEGMHEIARDHAMRQRRAVARMQGPGRVRQGGDVL